MRTTDHRSLALLPHSSTYTGVLATVRRFPALQYAYWCACCSLRLIAAFSMHQYAYWCAAASLVLWQPYAALLALDPQPECMCAHRHHASRECTLPHSMLPTQRMPDSYRNRDFTWSSETQCYSMESGNTRKSRMSSGYSFTDSLDLLGWRRNFPPLDCVNQSTTQYHSHTTTPIQPHQHTTTTRTTQPPTPSNPRRTSCQRLSLNRSQYGGCSTKYDTSAYIQVVCRWFR